MNKKKKQIQKKATVIYDKKVANSFQKTQYYDSQNDYRKNIVKIDETKRIIGRLADGEHYKVTELINEYIKKAESQEASVFKVLEKIRKKVQNSIIEGKPIPKHNDLIGLISNKYILLAAYKHTRKNKGSMTMAYPVPNHILNTFSSKGQEFIKKSTELPDGLSWETIEEISQLIQKNEYPWGVSRRIWIPKPGTLKKRPITIPPFSDKIVQEAIRIVLEAIYEPVFQHMNCSFGFRSSISVHNAIIELKDVNNTSSMTHAIEGDIENAYPSLNHGILLKLLEKRISDKKFIRFLKVRLKYTLFDIDENKLEQSFLGIPQGGIDAPYLWNIYLLEMDKYIQIELMNTIAAELNQLRCIISPINKERYINKRNNKPTIQQPIAAELNQLRCINPLYQKEKRMKVQERAKLKNILENRLGKELYYETLSKIKKLSHNMRNISYYDPERKKIRLKYVRYADDFIILTNAPKDIHLEIKYKLTSFLEEKLALTLSNEKTKITNIQQEPAHFLGFEIMQKPTRKTAKTIDGILKRTVGWGVNIAPDRTRLLNRYYMKGYCQKDGFPREISVLSTLDAYTLFEKTNAALRGTANYYIDYITHPHHLKRWLYILRWSCIKTLAQKHHTNINGVFQRYPDLKTSIIVKTKSKTYKKSISLLTEREAIKLAKKSSAFHTIAAEQRAIRSGETVLYESKQSRTPRIMDSNYLNEINWTVSRTQAGLNLPCLICGALKTEMHHVKHIRKNNWSEISETNFVQQLQFIRNRKQIPVCKQCHLNIHNGKYNGTKLDTLLKKNISDIRISNIESYIIPGEPYEGLPLEQSLLEKGWEIEENNQYK